MYIIFNFNKNFEITKTVIELCFELRKKKVQVNFSNGLEFTRLPLCLKNNQDKLN